MSWKNLTDRYRDKLNDRQRLYVAAYLETMEGATAAEMAGFSKKSARDQSKALQRHPTVRAAIEEGLEAIEQEWKDKVVKAMEHAYCLATVDIGDLFDADGFPLPLHMMPANARRAISSIEVEFGDQTVTVKEGDKYVERQVRGPKLAKFKLHDKRAAAELFARYAGRLKDRVELDATQNYADMVLAAQRKREVTNGATDAEIVTDPVEPAR